MVTSSACLAIATIWLGLTPGAPERYAFGGGGVAWALAQPGFMATGALILTKRPEVRIGWIFLAMGVAGTLSAFCNEYALYGLIKRPGSLPQPRTAAWVSALMSAPSGIALALAVILFPDGRLPSRRWRWLPPALFILAGAATVGTVMLWPARGLLLMNDPGQLTNVSVIGAWMLHLPLAIFPLVFAVSVAGFFVRFRRSRAIERQQLKWLGYSFSLVVLGSMSFTATAILGPGPLSEGLGLFAGMTALGIPAAAAIAILRYRLYEIDRVINRTIVYTAVTAMLAGAYALLVVTLQQLVGSLLPSDLSVAASTLAVAALFAPVRRKTQSFVNRRFYRSRCDPQQVLDALSGHLRNATEVAEVQELLIRTIQGCLQPGAIAIWRLPQAR